jgi:phospholipase C
MDSNHHDPTPNQHAGSEEQGISRRGLLKRAGGIGAALTVSSAAGSLLFSEPALAASQQRAPGSLPYPGLTAGTVNTEMPFDHIVVVMMENHSFDNLLGQLPIAGQSQADGLTFDSSGNAQNSNPGADGTAAVVTAYPFTNTAQGGSVSQDWNATHEQIDNGQMDGFVQSVDSIQPMGYFPPDVVPFAYSFANTFTVANRWFCSAPCQTYPNRRFLMAGTAYGDIATDADSLLQAPPPNGTIFDQLEAYGISWANYYTDLPQTLIIPSIVTKYPGNVRPLTSFLADLTLGTLPQVSFVDPEFGVVTEVGSLLAQSPAATGLGDIIETLGGDEENPQDMYYGETWAYSILQAVMNSPSWPRTLLIYTYDEHGGYYDHVPPPAAIAPDNIPPELASGDAPGGYDIYGPRVPAMVASPYSIPNGVTNVVHDHTSVLATIEAKWNLPALTYRDANAATVMDFLDLSSPPAFLDPPTGSITAPSLTGPSGPVL